MKGGGLISVLQALEGSSWSTACGSQHQRVLCMFPALSTHMLLCTVPCCCAAWPTPHPVLPLPLPTPLRPAHLPCPSPADGPGGRRRDRAPLPLPGLRSAGGAASRCVRGWEAPIPGAAWGGLDWIETDRVDHNHHQQAHVPRRQRAASRSSSRAPWGRRHEYWQPPRALCKSNP